MKKKSNKRNIYNLICSHFSKFPKLIYQILRSSDSRNVFVIYAIFLYLQQNEYIKTKNKEKHGLIKAKSKGSHCLPSKALQYFSPSCVDSCFDSSLPAVNEVVTLSEIQNQKLTNSIKLEMNLSIQLRN